MYRSRMSIQERGWRSRLCQWLRSNEVLHGTVALRERVCGKVNCKCVSGDRHAALYLVRSHKGKVQQVYVPKQLEGQVRKWAKQYEDVKGLLEKVAQVYWEKVSKREV